MSGMISHERQLFPATIDGHKVLYHHAQRSVTPAWSCRFWTANTEGISDTWITQFPPFLRNYGQDDLLTKQLVDEFISKPELYLASIYWAFTTVSPFCHALAADCMTISPLRPLAQKHLMGAAPHSLVHALLAPVQP